MANYCSGCGSSVNSGDSFCSYCGCSLNGNTSSNANTNTDSTDNSTSNAEKALGTLVAVSLVGGLTRQLYYHNGRYFLDPHCRNPFVGPRILGHHRQMGMHHRPMHRGGFGGPRGGGFGGPRGGGFGGPRGGHR